jgi:hypothetical protein
MDIIELNKNLLASKKDHMIHTIKYRKVVKKIISLVNIPEVLYKFILNYVGSSPFPINAYSIRPHSFPKNTVKFHRQALEESPASEQ